VQKFLDGLRIVWRNREENILFPATSGMVWDKRCLKGQRVGVMAESLALLCAPQPPQDGFLI
jgi:hypothetical protein